MQSQQNTSHPSTHPAETALDSQLRSALFKIRPDPEFVDSTLEAFPTCRDRKLLLEQCLSAEMDDTAEAESNLLPSEYNSLREQMATVMELILYFRDAEAAGKQQYTSAEVIDALCRFAGDNVRNTGR